MRTTALFLALALAPLAAIAEYADVNGVRMYYEIHGEGRPTVLLHGGSDSIAGHEHTLAMFRALPQGQLFLVPGTGHNTFARRPEWMNAVILSFLDEGTPGPAR